MSKFHDPEAHWEKGRCVHCGCPVFGGASTCPNCGENPHEPSDRFENVPPEEENQPVMA